MQRLLILTFLVLFSSCGKEDVFVFEGRVENAFQMSADYSVQFTIIDEKVHYIVTLKNKKYPPSLNLNGLFGWDANGSFVPEVGFDLEVDDCFHFAHYSKCYDKHGNVLFDFTDYKTTEKSDGVWKGVLNNVQAETVRKVSKVPIELMHLEDPEVFLGP